MLNKSVADIAALAVTICYLTHALARPGFGSENGMDPPTTIPEVYVSLALRIVQITLLHRVCIDMNNEAFQVNKAFLVPAFIAFDHPCHSLLCS